VVGGPGRERYAERSDRLGLTVALLFSDLVGDAEEFRIQSRRDGIEKVRVSGGATEQEGLGSSSARATVVEEQREEVGCVVEV
jgi:hypothetical protein